MINPDICVRDHSTETQETRPIQSNVYVQCNLYNEDIYPEIWVPFDLCNVPIGTNLYKSTSEMRTPLY